MGIMKTGKIIKNELERLGRSVVGYHFCQLDNAPTCKVAQMVHSLAAQIAQAPCMKAYQQLLSVNQDLRTKLSLTNCAADPDTALVQAVLLPLAQLSREGKIEDGKRIILIDALCDSQIHRPDYGDTIINFLSKHLGSFPPWLKLVCTIRTDKLNLAMSLPFDKIR